MEFIRKNFVTILVVGATVVLAGVAVFTATRLYQLRDSGVTPVQPELSSADEAPVGVRPSSGNWDLPETFIVTNSSNAPVEVVWQLDCWDETVCEDEQGTTTLSPGESFEEGLGVICSQWQLDINYSGTSTGAESDIWDFSSPSAISPECDFDLSSEEATESSDLDVDTVETTDLAETENTVDASNFEVTQCSVLSFSTDSTDTTGVGGAVETTPTATATPVVTSTPTQTATATATPVSTDSPELPEAGVGLPTIMGVGLGAILLIAAMALAL